MARITPLQRLSIQLRAAALRRQLIETDQLATIQADIAEYFGGDVLRWLDSATERRLRLRRAYAIARMVKAGWSATRIRRAFPFLSRAEVRKAQAMFAPDPYEGETSCGGVRRAS